jgi:glycosyltransferase A (GT-A) superfamily protein (DUF2064 family)
LEPPLTLPPQTKTPTTAPRAAVVLFVRAPSDDGKVLGFGAAGDARALSASLRRTLEVVRKSGAPLVVVGEVAASLADFNEVHTLPQRGDGFAARLDAAVRDAAGLGFDRLVVVGGDTPDLDDADLAAAVDPDDSDVVIGPTVDGGFYLLSLAVSDVAALAGLPYQTPGLLAALLARLGDHRVRLLAPRIDVDDAASARAVAAVLDRLCRRFFGVAPVTAPVVVNEARPADVHRPATPATGPPTT